LLLEFPADDPDRARRFWSELAGVDLEPRRSEEGTGWQSRYRPPAIGVHVRARGPGDSDSLPYFAAESVPETLKLVRSLGGNVVHAGEAFAVCKDSEGSPFGLAGPPASKRGSPDANKDLVTRFYAEAINGRDLGAVERLLTADFVHNGEARGREGQREAVAAFLTAFPDLHTEIKLIFAEGDLVCAHQRWRGTHESSFLEIAPTGSRVTFTSTAVLRARDGLIAEAWDEVDIAGLIAQLRG
jgi:predicted ester cyclase/predicted enzyme related to lactoylglutathione lyase